MRPGVSPCRRHRHPESPRLRRRLLPNSGWFHPQREPAAPLDKPQDPPTCLTYVAPNPWPRLPC
ncbi:hypothetical protein GBAR_LOCUS19036 [Geodia barretti]|uniref:Uncharacterized protein n=1 Tax=Geodia barretti TaxID=519541 RepID=A0AA35SQC0_GEOBA|nr:hypothetical protein GBAR_LOCUS19033 [Geodia barretti]CAI8033737.1 hypothetical protein GBAR_LOCUS19036 [Geodia barretti]